MSKKIITVLVACAVYSLGHAQIIHDTVVTNPTYSNNVWYSLENDDQGSFAADAWDISLATAMSANNELTTAVWFNHKIGKVYEIPGSDPTDFANADTTGLSTWTPLFNSDDSWSAGAFNNTANLGQFDYGWGDYNMTTHGVDANRIFVIAYTNGDYKKLTISSSNTTNVYTLTFDNLANTDLVIEQLGVTPYTSKNFISYNLTAKVIVDREPAAADWDLYFHQYPSFDYDPPYTVTGIFHNAGVQVAEVYPVNDVETFVDFSNVTWEESISTIGYNWKTFDGMAFVIADSTVYFVVDKSGSVWKLVMEGFGGSANGKYMFGKEKLSGAGLTEENAMLVMAYPNPAADQTTLVLNNAPEAQLTVCSMNGTIVYSSNLNAGELTTTVLNTSDWANGFYQMTVASGNAVSNLKLVVQH
jgi:hypothetical protein